MINWPITFFPFSSLSFQLPLEMQSKVASYMKLDSQSDSECSVGNLTKGKYQILPTNDDEAPLTGSHYSPASVINNNSLGKSLISLALHFALQNKKEIIKNSISSHQITIKTVSWKSHR